MAKWGTTPDKMLAKSEVKPLTGLWSKLTPAQKERALAYRGPENLGPTPELRSALSELRLSIISK